MSKKIKMGAAEAAHLVLLRASEDTREGRGWQHQLQNAKESGNAVTIDLRHYAITDNLVLQARLWHALFSGVKVNIAPLPKSFIEELEREFMPQ